MARLAWINSAAALPFVASHPDLRQAIEQPEPFSEMIFTFFAAIDREGNTAVSACERFFIYLEMNKINTKQRLYYSLFQDYSLFQALFQANSVLADFSGSRLSELKDQWNVGV